MPMMYQQIECIDGVNPDAAINSARVYARMFVWVEVGRVKAGNRVTFKETGEKEWLVRHVYDTKVSDMNRGWGLNLPKSQRTER